MMLYFDRKRAADLVYTLSVGRGTTHMDCRIMFLRELKEDGVIRVQWIPSGENSSDIFTKNFDEQTFIKHVKTICGESE